MGSVHIMTTMPIAPIADQQKSDALGKAEKRLYLNRRNGTNTCPFRKNMALRHFFQKTAFFLDVTRLKPANFAVARSETKKQSVPSMDFCSHMFAIPETASFDYGVFFS